MNRSVCLKFIGFRVPPYDPQKVGLMIHTGLYYLGILPAVHI